MQLSIRNKGCDLGDEARKIVIERTERLGKYLDGLERAEVAFALEPNPSISDNQICEATLFGHGHVVRAKAAAPELLGAYDRAYERLEHRLEKLKGKLVRRTHPHHRTAKVVDPQVLSDSLSVPVTKSKQFKIAHMTTDEAVFQMEMLGHSFYFFKNSDTGEPAVVYLRGDGSAGVINAAITE